ncbi:MAG TPA: lasso peptide biosynthesis B2 protein [Thermoanaerobaculia bacterium]|nr:lasso peptide biosynthesis B2 protein [Thermoanaerobaculia bacterium]
MRSWSLPKHEARPEAVPRARPEAGLLFAVRVLLFAVFAVPLLLRLVKLPRLRDWLEPHLDRPAPALSDRAAVESLVGRIDALLAAGRPFVRSGCLTRGVTLYYFLRRAGAGVCLVFGMGKMGGAIAGHCWLVFAGEPLVEKEDPRPLFVETWRIAPSAAPAAEGERRSIAAAEAR